MPKSRPEVIARLHAWFSDVVQDYLWICDPYFRETDLWIVSDALKIKPSLSVVVFTSVKCQASKDPTERQKRFTDEWKLLSHENEYEVSVILHECVGSGDSIIHDRWWLTNQGGLRIGTSTNSLGLTKLSEISEMTTAEAEEKDNYLVGYVTRRLKLYTGQRVRYESFSL